MDVVQDTIIICTAVVRQLHSLLEACSHCYCLDVLAFTGYIYLTCWLGQSVNMHEENPGVDETWEGQLCSFKVKASRKRKFSELGGNKD